MNGRDWNPQELDHVRRSGDHPAAGGQRLRERGHPQIDPVLDAEQLAAPGAARAEDAERVGLVDHQPRAEARRTARRSPAAARRRPPSRTRRRPRRGSRRRRPPPSPACARAGRAGCGGRPAAWPARGCSRRGSRRGRRSRRSPCRPGARIVPSAPRLAWWPVVKTIAASVSEPLGQLAARAPGADRSCRSGSGSR